MLFQQDHVSVRYVVEGDASIISKWLTDPKVLQYYEGRDNPQSVEMVLNHFIHNSNSHEKRCLIEFDDVPIGYIQMYPVDSEWKTLYGYEASQNVWGMDQFIGEPAYWEKGIGTKLVQSAITYIMENTGAEAIAMDPKVNNERAIKCYEKCGFKKVKILKEHELHEGVLEDCWMMEYRPRGLRDMKKALIVIDVQAGMYTAKMPVHNGEKFLQTLQELIGKCRSNDITVIYVQHNGPKDHPLEKGTDGWKVHEAIAPLEGDCVVEKTTPDSFHKTNLKEVLQDKGIDHVIISGMQTEYCVDTTTRRAFSEGYKVTLVSDAHSTFNTEVLHAEDIVKHHNVVFGAFADVIPLKDLKVTASK